MREYRTVFAILRNEGRRDGSDYYSTHGTIGGMSDAIGYGTLIDARKFLTESEAQAYIDRDLPEWGRSLHHPAEIFPWDLIFERTPLLAYLHLPELEIPPELLEPHKGRLLIWRR